MALDSVIILNELETNKGVGGIVGLSKVHGQIYDSLAERDTGLSKYKEQVFRDQLLTNVRTLQYYHQRGIKDRVAYSLQKSALKALYTIYSSKLKPVNWSLATDLEALILRELLEIINQLYRNHGLNSDSSGETTIESLNLPLWKLQDLALKLISVLIDCNSLAERMLKAVENHLTNLMETICSYLLKEPTCEHTSSNVAIVAHCLCKLFSKNVYEKSTQRKLMSLNFICDCLFPLACEFAATEYPATIVDPIDHYESFESTGELKESDKALAEWHRRNLRKDVSSRYSDGCQRNHLGYRLDDDDNGHNMLSLPPAHACLTYLIYKLMASSVKENQDILVHLFQQKIWVQEGINYAGEEGRIETDADSARRKSALMNSIIALIVLGKTKLRDQWSSDVEIRVLKEFVLPNLEQDCLLMKVCKFQLLRQITGSTIEDVEKKKLRQAYWSDLRQIIDVEDFQDEQHKLFLIFVSIASEWLDDARYDYIFDDIRSDIQSLSRKSQRILVERVISLYSDYKILSSLRLIEMVLNVNQRDKLFKSETDRFSAKLIDSLLSNILDLLSTGATCNDDCRNPVNRIFLHLYSVERLRVQPLPDETVEKSLKIATICGLRDTESFNPHLIAECVKFERNLPRFLQCHHTNLELAFRFPLKRKAQEFAIDLLEKILKEVDDKKSLRGNLFKIILRNLGLYHATSSSLLSVNKRAVNKGGENENHNILFKYPQKITKIYVACTSIEGQPECTSSGMMSMLMSWPSSLSWPTAHKANKKSWPLFVKSAIDQLDNPNNYGKFYEARRNFVFALMAAFNYDPVRLETYWDELENSGGEDKSHIKKIVELWLEYVNKGIYIFNPQLRCACIHISYQALVNIHTARTAGKLVFLTEELTNQLILARGNVLEDLAELGEEAKLCDLPLKDYYAESSRQLRQLEFFIN